MRSLSVQVQPGRAPEIDMRAVSAAFSTLAMDAELVLDHVFDRGMDRGPYYNYTFDTDQPLRLWREIERRIYANDTIGRHLRLSSMAMCSSEEGWDDYLLLFHFDQTVALDSAEELGEMPLGG